MAEEVVRLANAGGLGPLYVVSILVALAVLLAVLRALGRVEWKREPSESPMGPGRPVQSGDGGAVVDSDGKPVTADPDSPGGGATGGMG